MLGMMSDAIRLGSDRHGGKYVVVGTLAVLGALALVARAWPRPQLPAPVFVGKIVAASWVRRKPGQLDMFMVRVRITRRAGGPLRRRPVIAELRPGPGMQSAGQWALPPSTARSGALESVYAYEVIRPQAVQGMAFSGDVVEYQQPSLWDRFRSHSDLQEKVRSPFQGDSFAIPPAPALRSRPTFTEFLTGHRAGALSVPVRTR
jgi:hypothetical protein